MTKEYETIRIIRNKMFPPKLEFGCEVRFDLRGKNIKGIINTDSDCCWGVKEIAHYDCVGKDEIKQILGLPVTLNDILLMMKGKIMILNSGEVRKYTSKKNTGGLLEHEYIFDIDLPLPIKDQTPETLRAIIKLIEN